MMNYSDSKYNQPREWIKRARKNKISWENIFLGNSDSGIDAFIKKHNDEDFWDISTDDWESLCIKQQENELESENCVIGPYIIPSKNETKEVFSIPSGPSSMWVEYKNRLFRNGFKNDSVNVIENTTHRILNKLSLNTPQGQPIKGLVIGNVQSGKTANMAALMSMAADKGWNVFIVLSGTIDNLRKQTQKRFLQDLHCEKANITWTPLENVKVGTGIQSSELYLSENRNERYFTVCLKNSTRLKNLLKWLNRDKGKKQQMKVLLIDDEADQAGVNASNIDKKEKTAINKAITNIIYDHTVQGGEVDVAYQSMNYIGYTATPYANVLNEGPGTTDNPFTMFPEDFVAVLQSPNEYFGPQQIFGGEGFNRLNIVNHISIEETQKIKAIEKEQLYILPKELLNSIFWFYCCVGCFRFWKLNKPISLLIHTSQRVAAHDRISELVSEYLKTVNKSDFVFNCNRVWIEQTSKLTIETFFQEFKNYGGNDIYEYPKFDEIKGIIEELINSNVENIKFGEDDTLTYQKGIHLCVDNGSKNNRANDDVFLRLAYPTKKDNLDFSAAFIVIGGATLSRGLTIEGLVSTYFLRTVKQADTLMQMGRWFGYRKHYELLPRIWMTKDTEDKFMFLSSLDLELKKQMGNLDFANQKPKYYGIKVLNTAKPRWMIVTSKNKMQKAIQVDMTYSGAKNQTTRFFSNIDALNHNIQLTTEFIGKLDFEITAENYNDNYVWKNIDYKAVFEYMENLELPETSTFVDIKMMKEWYAKLFKDGKLTHWNVVISSKKNKDQTKNTYINDYCIGKVNRAKKVDNIDDGTFNIGALRNPADLYADIDLNSVDAQIANRLKKAKTEEIAEIRSELGYETISELIIYIIDKDSTAMTGSTSSEDLRMKEDVVGIAINIPGGGKGKSYAEALTIVPINIPEEEGEIL